MALSEDEWTRAYLCSLLDKAKPEIREKIASEILILDMKEANTFWNRVLDFLGVRNGSLGNLDP